MALSVSQILVITGLILELISVVWTIRKLFYGYYKRLDEMGSTSQQTIRRERLEGAIVLLLLTSGMFLQALAVFY